MYTTILRSLSREYHISTESEEAAEALRFIAARPSIDGAAPVAVPVRIEPTPAGFAVMFPDAADTCSTALDAAGVILKAATTGLSAEEPFAPVLHAASLRWLGARIVLVGEKGAGKSTLTLHLGISGAQVEGDEHLVVRAADELARPRLLHVKTGSLPLLGELAEAVANCPSLPHVDTGRDVYFVDPAVIGGEWRIAPGTADHIVFLSPNHGGASDLAPLGTSEAFEQLGRQCVWWPAERRSQALARLYGLARGASTWQLAVGDLEGARAAIEQAIGDRIGRAGAVAGSSLPRSASRAN